MIVTQDFHLPLSIFSRRRQVKLAPSAGTASFGFRVVELSSTGQLAGSYEYFMCGYIIRRLPLEYSELLTSNDFARTLMTSRMNMTKNLTAPDFLCPNTEGQNVRLDEFTCNTQHTQIDSNSMQTITLSSKDLSYSILFVGI